MAKSGPPQEGQARLDNLRRMMLRLSVMVEEQDAELGRAMGELRDLLRQPGVDLALVDTLLAEAELAQETAQVDQAQARDSLEQTLRQLNHQLRELSPNKDRELDELDHALDLRTRNTRELTHYLRDYSRAQAQVGARLNAAQQAHQVLSTAQDVQAVAQASDDVPTQMLADLLHAVSGLANRIQLPPEQQEPLQAIVRELNRAIAWPDLMIQLNRLVELIVAVLNDEQQALENYLEDLNTRLSLIRSSVQKAQKIRQEFRDEGRQLDHRLQNHVATIQQEIQAAQTLTQLKSGVRSELDNLISSIDDFLRQSSEKEDSMARMMGEMVDVIAELEQQNQSIREDFERTRRQALTDELTGLPNRSAYLQRLAREQKRQERSGQPMALCVLDVDHFKKVNDDLGHSAGDRVLKILARQLKRWLRKTDFISRHGGEEFIILMPETTLAEAVTAMENLCAFVADTPFHFRADRVPITVSIGCTQVAPGQDPSLAFERADRAMYSAKDKGRNCVDSG